MVKSLRYIPAWIAALFRSCPGEIRRRDESRPFLVIGHRGAPCKEVENTIRSFETALADGANALEIDLCMTADGHLVLWHDWDPDGTQAMGRQAGLEPDVEYCPMNPDVGHPLRKAIHHLHLADFLEHYGFADRAMMGTRVDAEIVTLEKFMEWAVNRPQIRTVFLDIKTPPSQIALMPRMMECIQGIIRHYAPRFEIVYETPEPKVLEAMKRLAPGSGYCLDTELPPGVVLDPAKQSAVRRAIESGNAYAALVHPYSSTIAPWGTFTRVLAHDLRMLREQNGTSPVERIISFTINDVDEMRCAIRMGIDGLQTDKPHLLRQVVEELGVKVSE